MLYKRGNQETIEQVRADEHVREVLDLYRRTIKDADVLATMKFVVRLPGFKGSFGDKFDLQTYALGIVIKKVAKVYQELTGKSPRTSDTNSGTRRFDIFVTELFKAEGLDPPTGYKIKQAIKKKQ